LEDTRSSKTTTPPDGLRSAERRSHDANVAPSVGERGSSSFASAGSIRQGSESSDRERDYVRAVLQCYLRLPGTPAVISRLDRKFILTLFRQGVPLETVLSALVLGAARRTFRGGAPLPRVRAVHYFLPIVEEILESPPDPQYVQYLQRRLQPIAAAKREQHESRERSDQSSAADRRESVAENPHEPNGLDRR
jgi:hypothetical protein